MNLQKPDGVYSNVMKIIPFVSYTAVLFPAALIAVEASTNDVPYLETVVVEATALSRYRPAVVNGATFTDAPPEELQIGRAHV